MSATMSEASHSASGATDWMLMVQLPPLRVRGVLTISNCDVAAQRVAVQRVARPGS